MSIIKKIKDYYNNKNNSKLLFTTPSHSQGDFVPPVLKDMLGTEFFKCDFSEIDGFDNLRNPNGILKHLQDKLSEIYQSKKTFLLTNGSTSGILALLLSVLSDCDKVLIARNCHISVCNALVLTGAQPVWFMPEYDKEWGIFKSIKALQIEKLIKSQTDIKAVILTSPTYEGTFSEIEEISKVCKKYNVLLIVDEAHGALLNFGGYKNKQSILCGADASVQSLHKTGGAPNPCALLHLSVNTKISPKKVQDTLNLINTTSPSYPLMLAIEASVDFLASKEGSKAVELLYENIKHLKQKTKKNIEYYDRNNDAAKILIKIKGLSGFEACEIINKEFDIEEEFSNERAMLFITGIGTTKNKLETLAKALNAINTTEKNEAEQHLNYTIPAQSLTPRKAFFSKTETIQTQNAAERVCARAIAAYPPGIPLVLPGEVLTHETIDAIEKLCQKTSVEVVCE